VKGHYDLTKIISLNLGKLPSKLDVNVITENGAKFMINGKWGNLTTLSMSTYYANLEGNKLAKNGLKYLIEVNMPML